MKTAGLKLERMPPLEIPFRFFVTAPLFGILAALLLLTAGMDGWSSRWLPAVLAATHMLTLGFMATVMLGALFQVLPVLSGYAVPGQRRLAPLVQLLIAGGTLALGGAFFWPTPGWQLTSLSLLGAGFALFIGALALCLLRRGGGGDSMFAIRLAVLSLLAALALGAITLGSYLGMPIPAPLVNPGIAHLRFALLGWVLLLMMGVSYQVIPMFHVTPNFPRSLSRLLPAAVFAALAVLTFSTADWLTLPAAGLLITTAAIFAGVTLNLFRRRKRKVTDYTIRFWQLGLVCLMLALLGYALALTDLTTPDATHELLWGVLIVVGFATSIIIGMLYKIAPFLTWLHLQQAAMNDTRALLALPTMHDLLPVERGRMQFQLHSVSLILLLIATKLPQVAPLAAIALAADFAWLELSLLRCRR